jgi:hypothetical protein
LRFVCEEVKQNVGTLARLESAKEKKGTIPIRSGQAVPVSPTKVRDERPASEGGPYKTKHSQEWLCHVVRAWRGLLRLGSAV